MNSSSASLSVNPFSSRVIFDNQLGVCSRSLRFASEDCALLTPLRTVKRATLSLFLVLFLLAVQVASL